MTAIQGASAAITGAASGIGRALAIELAARGADLALADRDEAGLAGVAAEIAKASGRKVSVHRADVAKAAVAAHPGLNILINNAGVALLGQFHGAGANGVAVQYQFLGRGSCDPRLPAASCKPARSPHRQRLEHLRDHRATGPDCV